MNSDVFLIVGLLSVLVVGWLVYSKQNRREQQRDAPATRPSTEERIPAKAPSSPAPVTPAVPRYAFVDLETTGLDRENDRIIEICVFIVTPGQDSHDGKVKLVNPGRPLTPFVSRLTGITNEMLANQPGEEVLHEFFDMIGDYPVYAYNAPFDMGFLRAAARRLGRKFENRSVCIMEMVKTEHPNLRSYKLGEVCDAFGIEIDEDAHRAEGDTRRALFLWDAVNRGKQPRAATLKPDRTAREYGVYGHYTPDGVLFYVWTAKDEEPSIPESDLVWSEFVGKRLQGRYEIKCIRSGVDIDQARNLKDMLLAEHARTVLNRGNPHRRVLPEQHAEYVRLEKAWTEGRDKGKELERVDPQEALKAYRSALVDLEACANLIIEDGLFGEVTHEMNRQAHGGNVVKLLDRITLLLCRTGRHQEANAIAQEVLAKYPRVVGSKGVEAILKRVGRRRPTMDDNERKEEIRETGG